MFSESPSAGRESGRERRGLSRQADRAVKKPPGKPDRVGNTARETKELPSAWLFLENSIACHTESLMPIVLIGYIVPTPVGTFSQVIEFFFGEFDPGSGRTLAACLTHASRTMIRFRPGISGERVSNTWATCPPLWDNSGKPGLILDMTLPRMGVGGKFFGGGWARGLSACWWGDGLPRRRRVAGLRG